MWTILLIIFIYLLYLVLKPMLKVWRTMNRMKKGDFSGLGDIFGQPGAQKSTSAYDASGQRKAGWSAPGFRKKKIGKDVGEYVKFSEITVTETENTRSPEGNDGSYTTEQQVTDVEWEDIK